MSAINLEQAQIQCNAKIEFLRKRTPNMIRISILLSFNWFVCHLHFGCARMSVSVFNVYSFNYDCFVEALCAVICIQFVFVVRD